MFWDLQKTSRKWCLLWFLIRNTETYKLQLSALCDFKTPEITSMAELLSSEATLTTSLQNNCSKQQQTLSGKLESVFEKDFTIDVLINKKLWKAKIKASKSLRLQNFTMPMPMPTWMPMLMPRCRCRNFQMVNFP